MQNPLKMKVSNFLRKPFVKWGAAAFVLLFIVYGVVGFFVVPTVIQSKGEQFVSEKFQRKLEFGKVSFNPYTLTVDLEGIRLTEPERDDSFASFDSLTVNLSSQSLFRMAPVIEEIRLVNPRVHLVRTASNHYNFDDFVAFAAEPKEDDSPARFSINNIQVENAVIEFDDLPLKKKHVVDELDVSIPFISTIPSQVDIFVDLAVNGKFNQEKIELAGKARPFFKDKDGTVKIRLDKISLPVYMDYLPFRPNFVLKNGRASVDLQIGFGQPENEKLGLTLDGNVIFDSLVLAEGNGRTMVQIPELGIGIAGSDVLSGKINIGHILLKRPEIYLERDKAGQWNILQAARIDSKSNTEKKQAGISDGQNGETDSQPFSVSLGKFSVEGGQLRVHDLAHVIPADFSVGNFGLDVEGVVLDISGKNAVIDKIVSAGTQIQFVHGKLKFQQDEKQIRKTVHGAAGDIGEQSGFGFRVGRFELNDWSISFENRAIGKPVVTRVDGLNVAVDNLSSIPEQPVQVAVRANVNRRGSIAVGSNLYLSPFRTDLDVDFKDVDIRFVQPYIEDFVNLSVSQADLTVKGKLQLSQTKHKGLQGHFVGDAGISRLATVDQLSRQPFVNWKTLALKGMRVDLEPLSVVIGQVRLDDLTARIILGSQGRLNLQDILRSKAGGQKSLVESEEKSIMADATSITSSSAVKNGTATGKTVQPDYSVQIKKWLISNGKIRFSDNFIRPRYTANLVNLRGTVSGLTTDPEKQAVVDVKGHVNGAPLVIAGTINPLSESLSLDIRANVKGMELAQFSSYSGKYIGYGINKGKLSFDVAYRVENDQLSAENALVLDQLTLGEKVESESAVNLPVQLALSLLKDRNGVIDINLPIGGSLNDPEFSVGGIIFKVFVNLVQKAVTAPFSLLASIVGDTEELSWVAFDPGSYALSESGQKKLEALARALEDRPGLRLEITGKSDPDIDSIGLGKKTVMRKIRAMKAGRSGQDVNGQRVTVSDREYPDLLKRLYDREDFDKPKNWIGFSKSIPVAEMEKLLSQHFAGKQDDMILLANRRARAVKEWLIENGKIPEERLFLLAGSLRKTEGEGSGNRVDFSLK